MPEIVTVYSFQVTTLVTFRLKKITIEIKVTLILCLSTCSLVNLYQGFGGTFCLLLQVREVSLARKDRHLYIEGMTMTPITHSHCSQKLKPHKKRNVSKLRKLGF